MTPVQLTTRRPDGTPVTLERFEQTRYRCPGCRKSWASPSRARKHIEDGCWRDRLSRSCLTCRHYLPPVRSYRYEDGGPEACDIDAADIANLGFQLLCDQWADR